VSGIWTWGGAAWTTGQHDNQPFWDFTTDSYVPLDQNLQRVIVRDGLYCWWQETFPANFFRPAGGVMTYVVLVGNDGIGLSPVETQHIPVVMTEARVETLETTRQGAAHGYVPNLNIDLAVHRTNGVDRDTQTHIQVRRIFNSDSFEATSMWPSFYGAGELLYLGHTP